MSKRWIANIAKKQPVLDDVEVDTLHKDGAVTEDTPAGYWSDTEVFDISNWWEQAKDSNNTIIAWRLSN